MTGATVLVGVGPFGGRVITRIGQGMNDPEGRVRRVAVDTAAAVVAPVEKALEELLQAGQFRETTTGRRLDVFVVANTLVLEPGDLTRICRDVGGLVQGRYGAMFDLRMPPEQRTAALHLVLWAPALGRSEECVQLIRHLEGLESWYRGREGGTSGNVLARVWLLPQVGRAGALRAEGLIASASAFVLATVGSGLRESDRIRELMRHPRAEDGRFALLTVASLTVPEEAVRRYARERAVYDGLEELRARVQGDHQPDRERALAAVASLEPNRWTHPLDDASASVVQLKKLAAQLSGAANSLPAAVDVGAFDDATAIREKHLPLYRAASVDRTLAAAEGVDVTLQLKGLDKLEAQAIRELHQRLRALFDQKLRGEALRPLPDVENGLKLTLAAIEDQSRRKPVQLNEAPAPPDPHREELENATAQLPDARVIRLSGLVAGLAVAFPVFTLIGGAAPAPVGAPTSTVVVTSSAAPAASPFPVAELVPFGVALVVGLLAGGLWVWLASNAARARVRQVLTLRLEAVRELWSKGGGGRNARQADDQVDLRRERVRRVAREAVAHALAQVAEFKLSVVSAMDRSARRLGAMSVNPTANAATDDLARLWGEPDHLHQPLVAPRRVAAWVSQARVKAGAAEWADALLAAAWPARDDDGHDAPCADDTLLAAAAGPQIAPLEPQGDGTANTTLLTDPRIREEAAEQIGGFVQRAVAALDRPATPLHADGTPAGGADPGPIVLAPRLARDRFEDALKASPLRVASLWVDSPEPRVLFVRAWEGFYAADLARGAEIEPDGGGR